MASPKNEVFFVYNEFTGVPLTGQAGSMGFDVYKDTSGANLSQPTITEISVSGVYQFTPVFADPTKGIVYILNAGAGASPSRVARFMRPEDYLDDDIASLTTNITSILNYQQGNWEIKKTGPDANRLIIYAPDEITVLAKYDLTDDIGSPTPTNVFKRDKI